MPDYSATRCGCLPIPNEGSELSGGADGRETACFCFGGAAQPEDARANSEFACKEFALSSTPLRASGSASENRSRSKK